MKNKQTKTKKILLHSHASFQMLYIGYFPIVFFSNSLSISCLHDSCERIVQPAFRDFSYCYCLNWRWNSSAKAKKYKNKLFIYTFFLCVFSDYLYFHDAWAQTASMSIFLLDACLLKPVGIDVQTSNSYKRNMFYIHTHSHKSGGLFSNISTLHGSCEKQCRV